MTAEVQERRGFRAGFLIPLIIVAALVGFFLNALFAGDPSKLPSALIGKPVPEFSLEPIEGLAETAQSDPGLSSGDLAKGEVSVVNIWASWCGPCIQEHPLLTEVKGMRDIRLVGINYKDQPDAAKRFLTRLGNPYDAIGADITGRVGIDWGVYGVPETFVVNGQGQIVYKFVGPLTPQGIENELLPAIDAAKKASPDPTNDKTS